jgi:hypothetical protein
VESSGGSLDGLRDLLVNKICALLSRAELRDLVDTEALMAHGVSLDDAIASAPRKDSGSPLTLAWVLQNFDLHSMTAATGVSDEESERLDRFRLALIDRLLSRSLPTDSQ